MAPEHTGVASCVCNCKDTNLKAIHNPYFVTLTFSPVVFATAKILIWKQFTTSGRFMTMCNRCVCNCKDTNLKAIHNLMQTQPTIRTVVFATAKILIWKQFTTHKKLHVGYICCVCNCKDTNLKAIHNPCSRALSIWAVVFATAKILIWKQFTTLGLNRQA